jgi:hypothetical protein
MDLPQRSVVACTGSRLRWSSELATCLAEARSHLMPTKAGEPTLIKPEQGK